MFIASNLLRCMGFRLICKTLSEYKWGCCRSAKICSGPIAVFVCTDKATSNRNRRTKTRAMRRMLPAGSGFLLLICGFSGNSEIQQGCGLQNVVFQPAAVALDNGLADVQAEGRRPRQAAKPPSLLRRRSRVFTPAERIHQTPNGASNCPPRRGIP